MANKACEITIGFFLILTVFIGCEPAIKATRDKGNRVSEDGFEELNPFYNDNIVSYYLYRKFRNGEKTERMSLIAAGIIPGEHVTRLLETDRYDNSYKRPVFVFQQKYIMLKNSRLVILWGFSHKEVLIDFNARIGNTLSSQVSEGWTYRGKSSYFGLPLYEMVFAQDPRQKIQYVHNLGFILDEYTYDDSVISWKLESIDGMPVDSFVMDTSIYHKFIKE